MNKYYQVLDKILATGKTQSNRKGNIQNASHRSREYLPPAVRCDASLCKYVGEITTYRPGVLFRLPPQGISQDPVKNHPKND